MLNQKLDIMKKRNASTEVIEKIEEEILLFIENSYSRNVRSTVPSSPFSLNDDDDTVAIDSTIS